MNHVKFILAALLVAAGQGFASEAIAKEASMAQLSANAEITFDGLHRVDHSKMDNAWVKPQADLSQYDAILFESAGIQYRAIKNHSRYDRSASAFPLSKKQRSKLEKTVKSAFKSEFSKFKHYEVTNKPGAGTLKVTIGLIDVVSKIPPENAGRSTFYIRNLGQAALVLEISDSVTNEILARIVDEKKVEPLTMQESNPATNLSEVKRSVRQWGRTIRKRLDDLHQLGCITCEANDRSS